MKKKIDEIVSVSFTNEDMKEFEELSLGMSSKENEKITEKIIEDKFIQWLKSKNIEHFCQVQCKMGTADIVTSGCIFEVKRKLVMGQVRVAVSQLIAYREYINKKASLYVIGESVKQRDSRVIEYARHFSVKVIGFENDRFTLLK